MIKRYKSQLTREQLLYNILYSIRNNSTEKLEDVIDKVLIAYEYKESSK